MRRYRPDYRHYTAFGVGEGLNQVRGWMVMVSLERERKLQGCFRRLVGCLDKKVSRAGGGEYLSYTIKNGSNGLAATATCVTMRD